MKQAATQKIYIIDNEPEICWMVKNVLSEKGFDVHTAFSGERGLEMAESVQPDLILLDLQLPDIEGLEMLQRIKERFNKLPVIILSAVDAVNVAVRAMKMGAYDYLSKPLNVNKLCVTLGNALKTSRLINEVDNLKRQITDQASSPLVWSCPQMQKVMGIVNNIAPYDVAVLIRGESGTGKELIAQHIHSHSSRSGRPMISVDCGALPETLVESELFGYERGAFTGANKDKPGRFESAQGGTLFLDEIGNLPLNTQVKLLRVLEERRFQRLGSRREIDIDVRLITAVNTDLETAMQTGMFREDLFHRLNEFAVYMPPLRKRSEEIDLLAGHFLDLFNRQFNRSIKGFSPEALWLMRRYSWPGNVR
ncbi:sigma-54-dependent Fis family transcriptional regulator, partial [bacterium]|nr:sigma-54-dependent Fis family transcriptional regulator [bacterium]